MRLRYIFLIAALAASAVMTASAKSKKNKPVAPAATEVKHPDWIRNAVIYEVNLRQGSPERTLKGFEKQLPRLHDLGVDVLWLMPVHPISELNRKGELGSYYAVKDYKAVNPEFGTLDDMKDFVKKAHDLGMKVIIDEVCNHSGCDNAWVTDNPDFYALDKNGKMFGPFDWTDTYKFDYSNPKMRAAMLDALKFWVKEVDIDGYRCDVAMEVPTDFWNDVRRELDAIKPVFMLAEASKAELTQKAFDADYNWPMKEVFNAIAATQGVNRYAVEHNQTLPSTSASDIDKLLESQAKEYPEDAFSMLMITNHDLNSWEGTEFDRLGPATGAFAVLSYTLPGIPMLYTGQEVGFNHAFEFFKQDITPDYTNNEFTTFYEMLNALRHNSPALASGQEGGKMIRYATSDPDVYVFSRTKGDNSVTVIANLSNKDAKVEYTADAPILLGMTNWFTGQSADAPSMLRPWEYRVFVK